MSISALRSNPIGERRATQRHQVRHKVKCCSLRDSVGQAVSGRVHDVSEDGIGLVLTRWVAPESSLTVTVLDANGDSGIFTVVRVKRILLVDKGKWIVGGVLPRKFSETELEALCRPTL